MLTRRLRENLLGFTANCIQLDAHFQKIDFLASYYVELSQKFELTEKMTWTIARERLGWKSEKT